MNSGSINKKSDKQEVELECLKLEADIAHTPLTIEVHFALGIATPLLSLRLITKFSEQLPKFPELTCITRKHAMNPHGKLHEASIAEVLPF